MYKNTNWLDHVVDADSGEVIQEGTEQSAANFNNMEQGIGDAHLALALLNIFSATNRARFQVVEVDMRSDLTNHSVSWPDGFSIHNTIVIPVITQFPTSGDAIQYIESDTPLVAHLSFDDSTIFVSCKIATNASRLVRLLLYRYK